MRNTPIEKLDLSVRAWQCLKVAGMDTVASVFANLEDVKKLRNMTSKTYEEIFDKVISFALNRAAAEKPAGKVIVRPEEGRITFEGNFCDIAQCLETPGGSFCEDGYCSQRKVWERLKYFEDMEEAGLLVIISPEAKNNLDAIFGRNSIEEDPNTV